MIDQNNKGNGWIIGILGLGVIGCGVLLCGILACGVVSLAVLAYANLSQTPAMTERPLEIITAEPSPTSDLKIGSMMTAEKDNMLLMYVPEGEFEMGSNEGAENEKPVHSVWLDAFWIDQTEVTNAMYAKCVAEGACSEQSQIDSFTRESYYDNTQFAHYPVIWVGWKQASDYCAWAGRRLPSEAEWEKAARGTDGRTNPWGDGIDCDKANYTQDCVGDTSEVGSYPEGASPYGALDMVGNVFEWVADWYGETYYGSSPDRNPVGPGSGERRVLRGGSWNPDGVDVGLTSRYTISPASGPDPIGFRCAASSQQGTSP